MPVKSHFEDHKEGASGAIDSASSDTKKLEKREIKMPDGRYMIFYAEPKQARDHEKS